MKPLILSLFLLSLIAFPGLSIAQEPQYTDKPVEGDTFTEPEIVDGVIKGDGFVPCSGTGCSACDFVVLANTLIKWFIGISFLLFAVLAFVAGIKLVTSQGNPGELKAAKSSFTGAFIGLFIIFAAWLLVDTLIRQLVPGDGNVSGYGPWSEVQCGKQAVSTTVEGYYEGDDITEPPMVNGVKTPSGDASVAGSGVSQAQAVEKLKAAGIGVKSGASLQGVRPHVIDSVIKLKQACNCKVLVTEGTGGTHSTKGDFTHANGFKLDLRSSDNPELVSFIKKTHTPAGTWSDGTALFYSKLTCGTYAIEKDHIDVTYRSGC